LIPLQVVSAQDESGNVCLDKHRGGKPVPCQARTLRRTRVNCETLFASQDCRGQIEDAKARLDDKRPSKGYYTIIDELLRGELPVEEKQDERLFLEALVLVSAATETTSWSK
jgi:hypothetical protein